MTSKTGGGPRTWCGVGLTDVGRIRTENQDAFAIRDPLHLWVVADGMGGHPGGDVASRVAVEALVGEFERLSTRALQGGLRTATYDPRETLRQAVHTAHRAILLTAADRQDLAGMGTTIVAAHVVDEGTPIAVVAHVGDSRAYLLRDGRLLPLTRDHSWVEDQVRRGLLSPAEALVHPLRHVLSRALGMEGEIEPEVSLQPLEQDDLLILCTDGLTKMLPDSEILRLLHENPGTPIDRCRALIEATNRSGGEDNITLVLIAVRR